MAQSPSFATFLCICFLLLPCSLRPLFEVGKTNQGRVLCHSLYLSLPISIEKWSCVANIKCYSDTLPLAWPLCISSVYLHYFYIVSIVSSVLNLMRVTARKQVLKLNSEEYLPGASCLILRWQGTEQAPPVIYWKMSGPWYGNAFPGIYKHFYAVYVLGLILR